MKNKNMQRGITLVALIITIIILLILAGISITSLTQTGLFAKAQQAKQDTENAQIKENTTLNEYEQWIANYAGGGTTGGTGDGEQISVTVSTSTTHTATDITDIYTWDQLSQIAKMISNNTAITKDDTVEVNVTLNGEPKTIGVGDTTTVDGKKVRILGFNHDTLTTATAYDGQATATGKAGISFEYVDFIDVDGNGTTTAGMNGTNTNTGGWKDSALKSTLNSTTYNNLSIKEKIKQVNKEFIQTYNDANSIDTDNPSTDYLWLLSCGEIWDNGYGGDSTQATRGYAIATEGSQYKYYKSNLGSTAYSAGTDITKKPNTSSSIIWWLRSSAYYYIGSFCFVSSNGFCDSGGASYSCGVAPGFCI